MSEAQKQRQQQTRIAEHRSELDLPCQLQLPLTATGADFSAASIHGGPNTGGTPRSAMEVLNHTHLGSELDIEHDSLGSGFDMVAPQPSQKLIELLQRPAPWEYPEVTEEEIEAVVLYEMAQEEEEDGDKVVADYLVSQSPSYRRAYTAERLRPGEQILVFDGLKVSWPSELDFDFANWIVDRTVIKLAKYVDPHTEIPSAVFIDINHQQYVVDDFDPRAADWADLLYQFRSSSETIVRLTDNLTNYVRHIRKALGFNRETAMVQGSDPTSGTRDLTTRAAA